MPRSVEHIVETHRIASERRKAGKPIWDGRVDVSRWWRDEDLSFEEKRDGIVGALKASRWYRQSEEFSDLHDAVLELSEAETASDFDLVWDGIYDLADYDRVWIDSWGPPRGEVPE